MRRRISANLLKSTFGDYIVVPFAFALSFIIFGWILFTGNKVLFADASEENEVEASAEGVDGQEVEGKKGLIMEGKRLFYTAFGNTTYACIYCHANFDEEKLTDGFLRPGHSLWNSFNRSSYYNGKYDGEGKAPLMRAINTCLVAWLEVESLNAFDPEMVALLAYLESISPDEEASQVTIEKTIEYPSLEGNARRGEKLFTSACVLCHRTNGSAVELRIDEFDKNYYFAKIRGIPYSSESDNDDGVTAKSELEEVPGNGALNSPEAEDSPENGADEESTQSQELVTPVKKYGRMPFFGANRLSDQEVADILAYLEWKLRTANTTAPAESESVEEKASQPLKEGDTSDAKEAT